ncbi:hypothetical protein BHE74_00048087 [Ensete ventricosum]|nr:hypothetical protein BHE74_00048087 [Ensete ventricosum]
MRPQVRVSALPVSGRPYDRWGFGLTCARSVARPLAPSYLRRTSFSRRVDHVGGPVVRRRATWLPLWLTIPSYTSTTPAVLAVRDGSTGKGIGLTCVRSTVRPLGIRSYLCQVGRTTTGAPIPASDQLPASGRPRRRTSYPKKQ